AAEAGQLLAGAEAVEAADLRTHGPGGHRADALDRPQPAHRGIGGGDLLPALFDGADLLLHPRPPAQALLQDPAGLFGELRLVLQPGAPRQGPAGVAAALAVLPQQSADL